MTRHSGIALGLALLGAAIGFVAACNFGAVLDPVFSQLHASGTFNKPFKAVIRQQPDPANNITGLLELSLDSGECSLNSLSTAVAGNSSPALGLLPTPTSIQLPSNTAVGRVQTFTGTSELARVTLNGFEFSLQTNTSFAVSRVNGTLPTGSPCADLPVEQRVSPASTIPIVELDAAVLANLRGVASRWLAAFPNSLISATLLQAPGQLILRAGKATTTSSLAPPQAMETKPGVYPVSLVGLLLEVPGSQLPAPGGTAAKEPQMALLVPAQTYVAPINMQAGSLTVALNSSITLSILAWLQPSSTPLPAPGTPLPRFGPGLEEAVRDLLNNPYQALYVQPLVNSSAGCVNSSSSSSGEGGGSSLPAGAAQGGSEGVGGTRCDPVTQTSSAQQQQQAAQPGQQACGCKPGWTGLGCSICSTDSGDDACAALMSPNVSGSGDKCVASLNYGPNTAYKTMSCEVQDRLRAYIQSTEVYCSTDGSNPRFQYFNDLYQAMSAARGALKPKGSTGAAQGEAGPASNASLPAPYCMLSVLLGETYGGGRVHCRAAGCQFFDGMSNVECKSGLACACVVPSAAGAPLALGRCAADVQSLVDGFKGTSSLSCAGITPSTSLGPGSLSGLTGGASSGNGSSSGSGSGSGSCTLTLEGMPTEVQAMCRAAGCQGPSTRGVALITPSGPGSKVKVGHWIPVIAGVPLFLSAIVTALCLLYFLTHTSLFRPPTPPQLQAAAAARGLRQKGQGAPAVSTWHASPPAAGGSREDPPPPPPPPPAANGKAADRDVSGMTRNSMDGGGAPTPGREGRGGARPGGGAGHWSRPVPPLAPGVGGSGGGGVAAAGPVAERLEEAGWQVRQLVPQSRSLDPLLGAQLSSIGSIGLSGSVTCLPPGVTSMWLQFNGLSVFVPCSAGGGGPSPPHHPDPRAADQAGSQKGRGLPCVLALPPAAAGRGGTGGGCPSTEGQGHGVRGAGHPGVSRRITVVVQPNDLEAEVGGGSSNGHALPCACPPMSRSNQCGAHMEQEGRGALGIELCDASGSSGGGWVGEGQVVKAPGGEGEAAAAAAGGVGLHSSHCVEGRSGMRTILHNVTGSAHGGQVVGVLGPSGAGKTTLLSLLSSSPADLGAGAATAGSLQLLGRMDPNHPTHPNHRKAGRVVVLAEGQKQLRQLTAFVAQTDLLLPNLTVAECLLFSALLRLPNSTGLQIQERVALLLVELGLTHIAHRLVGLPGDSMVGGGGGGGKGAGMGKGRLPLWCQPWRPLARGVGAVVGAVAGGGGSSRGLSGGERRRVSIGQELVTDPWAVIMDEPTSGLDSYTALGLLRSCKQLAVAGRVVIASLHQPSPELVSSLDCLMLMVPGGRLAYLGPPGAPALSFLAARGLACPPDAALAEHLLQCASEPDSLDALLAPALAAPPPSASPPTPRYAAAAAAATHGLDGSSSSSSSSSSANGDKESSLPQWVLHGSDITHHLGISHTPHTPHTPPRPLSWTEAAAAAAASHQHLPSPTHAGASVMEVTPSPAPGPSYFPGCSHSSPFVVHTNDMDAMHASPSATSLTPSQVSAAAVTARLMPLPPDSSSPPCPPGGFWAPPPSMTPPNPANTAPGASPPPPTPGNDPATPHPATQPGQAGQDGSSQTPAPPAAARGNATARRKSTWGQSLSFSWRGGAGGKGVGGGWEGGGEEVGGVGRDEEVEAWMAAHTLERRPGAWHQGAVLFCRTATDMWRNPSLLLMHVLLALVTGVVVGVIFLHQPFTLSGVQNRAGVLFFSLALTGFTALSVFDGLMLDRALVTREARAGHYHPAAYLVGRLALDALLLRALPATLFTLVLYPLAGLKTDAANVATLALVLGTFGATVGALAVCMAGLVDTPGKATLLMNLVLLLWVLLGGFLVNPTSIPPGIGWLRYCSPMPYAFEALVSNEVAGQTFSLSVPGIPSVDNIQGYALMTAIGLDASRAQSDVALLVVFFMGFNALAMAAFSWAAA